MVNVWWVIKQIFEKDLVYTKCKSYALFCSLQYCYTNFGAGLNYKDIGDPRVIVTLPSIENPYVKSLLGLLIYGLSLRIFLLT
jgi:hypothetical protein